MSEEMMPEEVARAIADLRHEQEIYAFSPGDWADISTVITHCERLQRENAEFLKTRRWNIEHTDGGIVVCEGAHDKDENCDWDRYVPIERAERAEFELAALKAKVESAPVVTVRAVVPPSYDGPPFLECEEGHGLSKELQQEYSGPRLKRARLVPCEERGG